MNKNIDFMAMKDVFEINSFPESRLVKVHLNILLKRYHYKNISKSTLGQLKKLEFCYCLTHRRLTFANLEILNHIGDT